MSTPLPSATLAAAAETPPTEIVVPTYADTPEAASNTPITRTSGPSTDLEIVELDPQYRPLYVDGIEYAAIGPEGHLYLVNVETGQVIQIAVGDHPIYQVALSDSHVAWVDANHIYVVDRVTGEEKRITEVSAQRGALRISGDWLVWMDRRNEAGQHYVNFDIYAHNLKTGEELPVAVAPGSQRSPSIHGHTVVWADNRNSPLAGAENRELPSPGCGDCPENRFDIYAMNLDTGEEQVLVENGYYNDVPDINGEYMAWRSYDPERLPEIRLLDLESGIVHTMVQDGNFWSGPSLSEEYLVWSTSWSCDVVVPGRDIDYTGVFAWDLNKGEIRKLTDYVEPTALMSGNMVVISEFCQVPAAGRVYAVFLD